LVIAICFDLFLRRFYYFFFYENELLAFQRLANGDGVLDLDRLTPVERVAIEDAGQAFAAWVFV